MRFIDPQIYYSSTKAEMKSWKWPDTFQWNKKKKMPDELAGSRWNCCQSSCLSGILVCVCMCMCVFVCICVCLSRKMTTVLLCTFFVCLAALWRIWHFRSICLLALHLTSAKLNRSGGLTLCLSVTPSLCLSAYLSVWLSIRLSVGPSIPLPVCNCDCTRCACKVVFHFISFQSTCISVTSTRPFFGGVTTPDRHYTSVSWIFRLFFRSTRQHMFPRGRYLAPTLHVKDKTRHSAKSWLATIDYETWLRFQSRLRVSTSTSHLALCDLSACFASCSTFVFTLSFPCRPSWLLSSQAHLTFHIFHLQLSFIDCCVA